MGSRGAALKKNYTRIKCKPSAKKPTKTAVSADKNLTVLASSKTSRDDAANTGIEANTDRRWFLSPESPRLEKNITEYYQYGTKGLGNLNSLRNRFEFRDYTSTVPVIIFFCPFWRFAEQKKLPLGSTRENIRTLPKNRNLVPQSRTAGSRMGISVASTVRDFF